jgi:hypothetical protein
MDSTLSWGLLVMKMGLILWLLDVKKQYRFFLVFDIENRTEPKPVGLNQVRFGFGFFFNSVWLFL